MINHRDLRTVQQFAAECPAFTAKQLYCMIYNREALGMSGVFRKIGRRWTINVVTFGEWWEGSTTAEVEAIVPGERRAAATGPQATQPDHFDQAERPPTRSRADNLAEMQRRWGVG